MVHSNHRGKTPGILADSRWHNSSVPLRREYLYRTLRLVFHLAFFSEDIPQLIIVMKFLCLPGGYCSAKVCQAFFVTWKQTHLVDIEHTGSPNTAR